MTKPNTHGGKRPGSGAPKKSGAKRQIMLRLSPDVIEFLERQGKGMKSPTVEMAVRNLKEFCQLNIRE